MFEAETTNYDRPARQDLDVALRLNNVTFQWAIPDALGQESKNSPQVHVQSVETTREKAESFVLDNISMEIPRGRLVALVGRVGSGKSSLLQGVSVPTMARLTVRSSERCP